MSNHPLSAPEPVCVRAFANIALVKYWGKRDTALNLPCTGSLSLTLDPLATITELRRVAGAAQDQIELNGEPASAAVAARVSGFIDLFRALSGSEDRVVMRSRNTFPTAAGLASSASAFAALALAAHDAFELDLAREPLSGLARQGSGSAARSLFGGFAEMLRGERPGGSDAHAVALHDEAHWPLRVVIAIVARGAKKVGSTVGMNQTARTSNYFEAWVECVEPDLRAARQAVAARDFAALTRVAERSALRMHASAIAADPGVLYWQPATVALIHAVRSWRDDDGLRVFFTIDAGPNVKVFCHPDEVDTVRERVAAVEGVLETLVCRPGPGAHRVAAFDAPTPL